MLIYSNSNYSPFGATVGYKSVRNHKRSSIPSKTAKRDTQPSSKAKKVKSSGKKRQNKSLNAKNAKFLKSLGFQIK